VARGFVLGPAMENLLALLVVGATFCGYFWLGWWFLSSL